MFCFINILRSHLTQVRGLKCLSKLNKVSPSWSHLTQVRGLKLSRCILFSIPPRVAPHAGAWIEMNIYAHESKKGQVAPHAGAWIEIKIQLENK